MNSVFNRRLRTERMVSPSSNYHHHAFRGGSTTPTISKSSPRTTGNKGFMKATAASQSRVGNITPNRSRQQEPEETLEKLKHNILRFTRSSDRRMLLRTLTQCSYLSHVNLPQNDLQFPASVYECQALENEVARSLPVSFNGTVLGDGIDEAAKVRAGKTLLMHLRILCNKIATSLPASDTQITSDELYYDVLMRLEPSRGASTAFQRIHMIAGGNKDLVVQAPSKPIKHVEPTSLVLYVSDGHVHCVVQQQHPYGLYRKSDSVTGKPWIGMTAYTHERVNLSTGRGIRELHVQVHEERFLMY